ncbi:ParB family chromosome partitioning protein [Stackebrandtia albiflava]|uniref:ParB family chromosome partitioning protein n=2 Tax=Stackebrandtia albiflava TaxID=406432 RepID=A0A562V0U4_9ACTN|nr:ParB family chromosome partitioning protein [Stackebrandtia albiflava]
MRKKGGLGRGLAALIPPSPAEDVSRETASEDESLPTPRPSQDDIAFTGESAEAPDVPRETTPELLPVPGAKFKLIPLDSLAVNPKQPREDFAPEELDELKVSLGEVGMLQPIAVRPLPPNTVRVVKNEDDEDVERVFEYELVMGERRTRAARALGWETVPAIVRETKDEDLLKEALLENIHRVQLNPLEEAAAYQQLLEEFGATQEDLSKRIGRSRSQISNMIRLLSLPAGLQKQVAAGVLTFGHARALLALPNTDRQHAVAKRIVQEGLSVRTTEEVVRLENGGRIPDGDLAQSVPAKKRATKIHSPGVTDLADRLSDRFETRVKVALGQKKGKIVIEFGSIADLERIAKSMGLDSREN